MTIYDESLNDDERAEMQWKLAATKTAVRYLTAGLWASIVSGIITVTTWPLAIIGAIHLGWVGIAAACGYLLLRATLDIPAAIRAHRGRRTEKALPIDEQIERLQAYRREVNSRSPMRKVGLTPRFWYRVWMFGTWPRVAAATVALAIWLPLPVVITLGALFAVWPIVARAFSPTRRNDQVIDMMLTRKGPDGLPTPEV